MSDELRERIALYLLGALGREETERLERELVHEEVAQIFCEEVMLRELLQSAPPDAPPEELVERIEAMVLAELADADPETRRRWFERTRAAFANLGWAYRGAAMSVATPGTQHAMAGVASTEYALGPLAGREAKPKPPKAKKKDKKPLWRRLATDDKALWRRLRSDPDKPKPLWRRLLKRRS